MKTLHVEELMFVKSVEAQRSPVGVVLKFGLWCPLRFQSPIVQGSLSRWLSDNSSPVCCTLNLSKAETSSRSSSGVVQPWFKITWSVAKSPRAADQCDTDHQIGTSVHAPQRPMVTYIGMGIVVPGPHGLLPLSLSFKFEDCLTLGIPLR
ncbi:hypothetical protein TNCV_4879061 [Trichonephila clavipes]|nr:hypothetical protein TNCV_4879061 [Trichonephila clavipes]